MFLSYEQVEADATVKTIADLTIPTGANGAMLQADSSNIRYTMDDSNDPSQTEGMILLTNLLPPETFLIQDMNRIRFTRGSGSNGQLNIHWWGGRVI